MAEKIVIAEIDIDLQALIKSMSGDVPKEKESANPNSRAKKK